MLVKCYECGREISDLAKVCPQCGAPMRRLNGAELKKKTSAVVRASVMPALKKFGLSVLPILLMAVSISIIALLGNAYYDLGICWTGALVLCTHCLLGGIAFLAAVKKAWGITAFKWMGWIDFVISYAGAVFMVTPIVNLMCFEALVVAMVFGLVPLYFIYAFVRGAHESKSGVLGWLIVVLTIVLSVGMLIGANRAANDRLLMRNFRRGAKLSQTELKRVSDILVEEARGRR